jgi:hypothetical protein
VTPTELDERLATAEAVAREAGRLAADYFARRDRLSVDRKGAQDLVNEAPPNHWPAPSRASSRANLAASFGLRREPRRWGTWPGRHGLWRR